jgi:membrane-bound lytic murein transglycosylase A
MPNSDPSYVFFRQIPDNEKGPIGALGVPLTAGRSVAVDPRTTPLGFPVFVSTRQPGRKDALNRLMLAQDTGGAISGAVRADYFWGFGASAFVQASRMKEDGRMWLLLPKSQKISANAGGALLRGVSGQAREAQPAECVVPDPELCVE